MTLSIKQVVITDKGSSMAYAVFDEVKYIDSYFQNGKLILDVSFEDKSYKTLENVINFIVS